jgi:hypothetical protein
MQKILLTCCLTGSAILPALAQTTPDSNKADTKPTTATRTREAAPVTPSVTVAGERPTNRIDRQVYDVKSDVSSTNGTAADASTTCRRWRSIRTARSRCAAAPTCRSWSTASRPPCCKAITAAPALQAMAADDIESVEVINNPGAQFGNEAGGGPILNLVMRRNRKPGGFTTVNANGGSAGRYNSAVNSSYNEGAWGFQGGQHPPRRPQLHRRSVARPARPGDR